MYALVQRITSEATEDMVKHFSITKGGDTTLTGVLCVSAY